MTFCLMGFDGESMRFDEMTLAKQWPINLKTILYVTLYNSYNKYGVKVDEICIHIGCLSCFHCIKFLILTISSIIH